MTTAYIILIYGILVAVIGAYGYFKASSIPSLIAGVVSGVLLLAAAFAMMRGSYRLGWVAALVVAILLLGRFARPAFAESQLWPGGVMVALSLLAVIALLIGRNAPAST
ncbi:MAG: TMEM14 family protein [Pyrinomonadaceae bacterium]|nr:TMEM14 family protein [Pyrinomonadaceae bacterium]